MGLTVVEIGANKDWKKWDKLKAVLIHKSCEVFNKTELC